MLLILARGSPPLQDPGSGFPSASGRCLERLEAALLEPGSRLLSGRALGDGLQPSVWEPGLPGAFPRAPRLFGGWQTEGATCRAREPWSPRGAWKGKAERQALDAGLLYCQGRKGHKHSEASKGPGRQVVPGASREAFFLQASPRRWAAQGQERALGGSAGGVTCK